ncbi:MAG TPA: hypothetical protein ENN67_02360 [Firmicutes bacterium]|nr:hypothetical protein [Bacillota bacterium]
MARQVCFYVLIIVVASIGLQPVSADNQLDPSPRWVSYNSWAVSQGIMVYYAYYGEAPDSLETLINQDWVPSNLTNHITGERIVSDCAETAFGGWSVIRYGESEVEILFNSQGELISMPWNYEQFAVNDTGIDIVSAKSRLYMIWALMCLKAFHNETGRVPESIHEIASSMFWPFENTKNLYSGDPMKFNSHEVGDMLWEFSDGKVTIRLWKIPEGNSESSFGFLQYPLSGI